jgi:hypothetical protein
VITFLEKAFIVACECWSDNPENMGEMCDLLALMEMRPQDGVDSLPEENNLRADYRFPTLINA